MPDPVSGTGKARSGIQNVLNLLDSGFRRNDGKENFSTFYESIKNSLAVILLIGVPAEIFDSTS
jgi:hypothetical protein